MKELKEIILNDNIINEENKKNLSNDIINISNISKNDINKNNINKRINENNINNIINKNENKINKNNKENNENYSKNKLDKDINPYKNFQNEKFISDSDNDHKIIEEKNNNIEEDLNKNGRIINTKNININDLSIFSNTVKSELLNKTYNEESEISSIPYKNNEKDSEKDSNVKLNLNSNEEKSIQEKKSDIKYGLNIKRINTIKKYNLTNNNINNEEQKPKKKEINENNLNENTIDIDKNYYTDDYTRSKSPIVYRNRNIRVYKKKILKVKGLDSNNLNKNKLHINNIPNLKSKKYISKTPEKEIKSKRVVKKKYIKNLNNNNNNNNNINKNQPSIKSQDYTTFKLNYDIKDINKTIKKIEEQIKRIEIKEQLNQREIINDNKIANDFQHIPLKQINNFEIQKERTLIPINRKINNKNKLVYNKSFDENDIKYYKDIMPEINQERKEKKEKYQITKEGKYIYIGSKTPEIQLRKKKIKKKGKKKNINSNINYNIRKNKFEENKSGFVQKRPAWK